MVSERIISNDVLKDLEKYLKTSKKVKEPVNLVCGLGSIILEMVSSVNSKGMLGFSEVDKALVRQWVEYVSIYYPFINKSSSVTHQVLKELNGVLSRQSYLVKNYKTVADIVLFYVLWNVVSVLSFQEKEQYLNVSRWFNTLQQDNKLRQSKPLICFSRTLLYQ
ncbi:aaRS-interacting multifunctional protein 3 [Lycorma delicatula]|uniref:aaRS-interacting multifunctional protein 3 n=1 Tax=Lycorma delicatula TaxID=130591 RepID=UPI003F5121E1